MFYETELTYFEFTEKNTVDMFESSVCDLNKNYINVCVYQEKGYMTHILIQMLLVLKFRLN